MSSVCLPTCHELLTLNTWTFPTRARLLSILCTVPWIVGCVGSPIQTETAWGPLTAKVPTEDGTPTHFEATSTPIFGPTLAPTKGTAVVEPSITAQASATLVPPAVALGEDCGRVEHLDPSSADAQRIVAEFERAQAKLVPFDPLVFEAVYEVSRQDGYLLIVGQRYETNWVWAGMDTGNEVTPLGAFVQMNGVAYSRFVIHDFFSDVLPDAPTALYGCYLPAVLPYIESDDPALIIDPKADCTKVQRPDLTMPEIQHFVPQMAKILGVKSEELLPSSTAWRVGDWIFVSASFGNPDLEEGKVDGAFLVRPPNEMLFSVGGGIYSRRLLMREMYRAYPDVPRLLLSCAVPVTVTDLRFLIDHGYYAFSNKAVWERTPMP